MRLGAVDGLLVGKMRGGVVQRHQHVFQRAGPGQQIEVLEDETDLRVAHHGALLGGQGRDVLPVQPVFSRRGAVQAAEDVHQRALARTAGAHQRDHLATLNLERNALEDRNLQFAALVGFMNVIEVDQFHVPAALLIWSSSGMVLHRRILEGRNGLRLVDLGASDDSRR